MSPLQWIQRLFQPLQVRAALPGFSRLGVESLGQRRVLAGNVTVAFANNTLTVTGDDAANSFIIFRNGSNIQVSAKPGTSLISAGSSATSSVKSYAVSDFNQLSVRIYGKGGNDNIDLGDRIGDSILNLKSFTVDTGAGADYFAVLDVRASQTGTNKITMGTASETDADHLLIGGLQAAGGLTVAMGGGNDYFEVSSYGDNRIDKLFSVDLGAGNDEGHIWRGTFGALSLKFGDGNDYVYTGEDSTRTIPLKVVGNVTIDGGNGNDAILFKYVDFGSTVTIKGGAGLDEVVSVGTFKAASTTTIDLGEGDNSLEMNNGTIQGAMNVKSGDGRDILDLGFLVVNRKLSIATKGGNDSLEVAGYMTVTEAVDINMGEGSNYLNVWEMSALGGFKYNGGAGVDHFEIRSGLIAPTFYARFGAGDDWVNLNGLAKSVSSSQREHVDKVDVDLGTGNDHVEGHYIYAKDVRLKLGTGDDYLYVNNSQISVNEVIDGGAGRDYGYYSGTYPPLASKRKILGFETGNLVV